MAPRASTKCGLLLPIHHRIGSCTRNNINFEKVPGVMRHAAGLDIGTVADT